MNDPDFISKHISTFITHSESALVLNIVNHIESVFPPELLKCQTFSMNGIDYKFKKFLYILGGDKAYIVVTNITDGLDYNIDIRHFLEQCWPDIVLS